MSLFHFQLLLSFLVGGGLVSLLTLLAERASQRMAGLIITIPSTVAMSFLFIGWTIGPDKIPAVMPPIPFGIGAVLMFATTYLYLSKIKLPKPISLTVCLVGALGVWFSLMLPLAIFEINDLRVSLAGFVVFTLLAHYLITKKTHAKSTLQKIHYTLPQILFRGAFIGAIITLAVFLAKTSGPLWGGVFAAFPAVFISSFLILHWHYDSAFLFRTFKNAPLGNIGFLAFVLVSAWSFPAFGTLLGLLVAYAASMGIFLIVAQSKS